MSDKNEAEAFSRDPKGSAGLNQLALFLLVPAFLFSQGCRTARQNRDVVERELRQRETQVRELKEELHKQQWLNHAMEQQVAEHSQQQLSVGKIVPADPGTAGNRVQEIALGRSTGGYDNDKHPGDEALVVALEPKDSDGHVIKASGTLQVTALEILPGGVKKVLTCWQVSPEELRRTWKTGLLSTGYQVVLPLKAPPASEKLRLVAQFVSSDGRVFEADKDVKLRLPLEVKPLLPQPQMIGPPLPSESKKTISETIQRASWRPVARPTFKVELGAPVAIE